MLKGSDTPSIVAPGLPNITGRASLSSAWAGADQGALYRSSSFNGCGDAAANGVYLNFDASRSNTIYGNSDTVQPATITLIPQIKY